LTGVRLCSGAGLRRGETRDFADEWDPECHGSPDGLQQRDGPGCGSADPDFPALGAPGGSHARTKAVRPAAGWGEESYLSCPDLSKIIEEWDLPLFPLGDRSSGTGAVYIFEEGSTPGLRIHGYIVVIKQSACQERGWLYSIYPCHLAY